ncbi:putative neprosin [Medicago truncatula]|uniref:Putative neprosin n=1 Tax=Medicago truncatula TaxID=3880 RepID=A0A396GSM8_MEDTR|nr:putative neprosin [Medicago truncatula]
MQIYPKAYWDNRTRFFIYWTADAYQNTGCYNVRCLGFVQTNKNVVIGVTLTPTSTYNGGQVDIALSIWRHPVSQNWWLEFGTGNYLGYWPSSIFTSMKDSAQETHWGGEIVNSKFPQGYFHTNGKWTLT